VIARAEARPRPVGPAPSSLLPRWTLIYDGDCRFCRRSVALLRSWDRRGSLRAVSFQSDHDLESLPRISRSSLEQAMHLVAPDGGVLAGAAAAPVILRLLPGGRPLAWAFAIPGVPAVANAVYRAVARNRHRLGCGSTSCSRGV